MIILNDSFRRVNAKGGRVGGKHPLYPDAGRVVKPDDFNSRFNFTSTTSDPFVGFGVIRDVVDDTGDAQFGQWGDLEYNWESGINKWEIRRLTVTIEVKSESQFVRQPSILFDIEIDAQGYREVIRTGSSAFGLHKAIEQNVQLMKAIELWNNTSSNWETLNELIIWSDAMYPPRTITDSASSLFGIRSGSSWFKDTLIRRTANLLLELQSSSITTQIDVFGDWATTTNEWQNLSNTLWEIYTSRTVTDTASSLISVSSSSTFFKDQVISRTANVAIGLNANSTFFIDQIISKSASSSIEINASATHQVISFGSWQLTNTNWESVNNLWETYTSGTISDSANAILSITSSATFTIDHINATTSHAVSYDGVDDYHVIDLDGTSTGGILASSDSNVELTISAWLFPQTTQSQKSLLSWGNTPTSSNPAFALEHNRIFIDGSWKNFSTNLTQNTWNHVLITRTASNNTWKVFLNGNSNAVTSFSDGGGLTHRSNAINFYLGVAYNGFTQCKVDDLAFWNSDQSSNLANIYGSSTSGSGLPSNINSTNPYGWWRMGDDDLATLGNSVGTISNSSGLANDMTVGGGSPTYTSSATSGTIFSKSASVSFGISASGTSQITQAEWASSVDWNQQQLIWEAIGSGQTITDTASTSILLKANNVQSDLIYGWNTDSTLWEIQSYAFSP